MRHFNINELTRAQRRGGGVLSVLVRRPPPPVKTRHPGTNFWSVNRQYISGASPSCPHCCCFYLSIYVSPQCRAVLKWITFTFLHVTARPATQGLITWKWAVLRHRFPVVTLKLMAVFPGDLCTGGGVDSDIAMKSYRNGWFCILLQWVKVVAWATRMVLLIFYYKHVTELSFLFIFIIYFVCPFAHITKTYMLCFYIIKTD